MHVNCEVWVGMLQERQNWSHSQLDSSFDDSLWRFCSNVSLYWQAGVNPSSVGVITPYRQQMTHIRELFGSEKVGSHYCFSVTSNHGWSAPLPCTHTQGEGEDVRCVEVNTVDRYQGRDKECILLSCVRSNDKGNVSALGKMTLLLSNKSCLVCSLSYLL